MLFHEGNSCYKHMCLRFALSLKLSSVTKYYFTHTGKDTSHVCASRNVLLIIAEMGDTTNYET
jgi:hypothetical protein